MPQINQLPTRTPTAGDTVPFYSSNNGDAAKTSFTAISTLISQLMGVSGGGGFITQYSSPTADTFTITVGGVGQSTWLIITPTAADLDGTITLPALSTLADQQELLVVSTMPITFALDGNGATVFEAPIGLGTGSSFRLKYDSVMQRWYNASGAAGGGSVVSASYIAQGGTTTIPSGDAVPFVGVTVPANAIITGSGLSVEMDSGNDYAILKGLSDTHAYSVTYCLSISGSEAADVQFDLLDDSLAIINTGSLVQTIAATVDRYACTFSATFTGQTEVVLGIGRVGSSSTIDIGSDGISARIVDLGIAE